LAKKKQREAYTRNARDVAREVAIGCSCGRDQLQQIFIAITE